MKKVFRLFISSTFDDFKLERAVLQRFVFPEIKKFLNEKELSFIPIDLRWGVPTEAQEDQKTMEICLNEVNRSAEELHPDFLVMVGDRYGWVPLPEKIEENEFKEIEKHIKEKELLNKWYKLDKNQIPSSYILQPVYEVIDKPTQKGRLDIWYKESEKLSKDIKSILDKTNLTDEQKEKYYLSATHQEFLYYKNISKSKNINPKENIIGYIREITPSKFAKEELTKAKYYEYLNGKELENYNNFKKEVSDLPNHYIQKIKDEEILKKEKDNLTTILTEEDIANLDDYNELPEYLKNFANEIKKKIFARIEKELQKQQKSINFQEYYKNQILKDSLINGELIGRSEDIKKIKELLETNNKIIISAESGTGKSAVIAKLIDELQKENKNIIYRFCGVGEIKGVEQLLKDILLKEFDYNFDDEFNKNKEESLFQIENKKEKFKEIKYKFLELTKDKLIIFDAIDQLEDKEDDLDWLPNNFIISVLNDKNYEEDSRYYRVLKTFPQIKEYKLKPLQNKENIEKIILQKLNRYNRKLTNNQLEYVLSRRDSKKPLYLTIAIQELKTWRDDENNPSYDPQKENSKAKLSNTQQSLIKEFIQNLYTIHRNDELLVKRTFGYIYASQIHLDEELLLEVLSNDEKVMKRVSNKWHLNITGKLPDAVWARLRGEIINFLKEDKQGNIQFFHREFKKVSEDKRLKIYSQKVGIKLLNILEKLEPNQKILEAHAHTLALLKMNDENFEINFEWFEKFSDEDNEDYLNILDEVFQYLNIYNKIKEAKIYIEIIYEIAKHLYSKNPWKWVEDYTLSLNNFGYLYQHIGKIEEAVKLFKKALRIIKKGYGKNPDRWIEIYIKTLNNFGYLYQQIGQTKKAEELYKGALKIIKKAYESNPDRWVEDYTMVLINLGSVCCQIGKIEEAEELFKKALRIIKKEYAKNPDRWIEIYIKTLNNFGYLYQHIGKIEEAVKLFKKAFKILKKAYESNPDRWVGDYTLNLNNLGVLYSNIGQTKEAEKLFKEALKIIKKAYETNPDRWVGDYIINLNNLGVLYSNIGQTKEAEKLFKEALKIIKKAYESNPDRWVGDYTQSLNNIGYLYYQTSKTKDAEELYKEALKIIKKAYETNPDRWVGDYIINLNNLGALYSDIGKTKEAEKFYRDILYIVEKIEFLTTQIEQIKQNAINFFEKLNTQSLEINLENILRDLEINLILKQIESKLQEANITSVDELPSFLIEYFAENELPEELIELVILKLLEMFKG